MKHFIKWSIPAILLIAVAAWAGVVGIPMLISKIKTKSASTPS